MSRLIRLESFTERGKDDVDFPLQLEFLPDLVAGDDAQ